MKGLYIPIILALTATLAATAPAEAISSKAPQQAAKNQRFIKMQQENWSKDWANRRRYNASNQMLLITDSLSGHFGERARAEAAKRHSALIESSLLHICSHKKLHNKRVSTLAIVAIKLYHLNKIEGQ